MRMTVKATAHSKPRGLALQHYHGSCQPPAAETRILLADRYACANDPALQYARTAWWYRKQVMAALSGID